MIRRTAAGLVGALTVVCALLANLALWVDGRVSTTPAYVATVAPLAAEPAIQRAVATHMTDAVYASIIERTTEVDERVAGIVESALEDIRPEVMAAAGRAVAGEAFAVAWIEAHRQVHRQLLALARGAPPPAGNGTIVVDLADVQSEVVQLVSREIPANLLEVLDVAVPPLVIPLGDEAQGVIWTLRSTRLALLALAVAMVTFGFLALVLARHPARAVVRMGLGVGAGAALTFYAVGWLGLAVLPFPPDGVDEAAAKAAYTVVTRSLQTQNVLLFLIAILTAIAAAITRRRLLR